MLALEIALLLPFFFGLFVGCSTVLRPSARPNFDRSFKKKYRRSEWNDLNPETFTRNRGFIVLALTALYGCLILLPWTLRS